jgi:hypothetical protein
MQQPHYNQNGFEYIKVAKAILDNTSINGYQGALWFNIGKYWWRMFHKNTPLENALKARDYLNLLIEELESNKTD